MLVFLSRTITIFRSIGFLVLLIAANLMGGLSPCFAQFDMSRWAPVKTIELFSDQERPSELRFSSDGSQLLVGDDGGNVYLVDVATANEIARFKYPAKQQNGYSSTAAVTNSMFTGKGMVVAWVNGNIVQMKNVRGKLVANQQIQAATHQTEELAFSPDEKKMAVSTGKNVSSNTPSCSIRMLDTKRNKVLAAMELPGQIGPIAFNRGSNELAYSVGDQIGFVDIRGKSPRRPVSVPDTPTELQYTGDGAYLVAAVNRKSGVKIFDLKQGTSSAVDIKGGSINGLASLGESALVAIASCSKIYICNASTGEIQSIKTSTLGDQLTVAASSFDGKWLALGEYNSPRIEIWRVDGEQTLGQSKRWEFTHRRFDAAGQVNALLFYKNEMLLAGIGNPDPTDKPEGIYRWNVEDWSELDRLGDPKTGINGLAAIPGRPEQLLVSSWKKIERLDFSTDPPQSFEDKKILINSCFGLAVSPDGKRVLIVGQNPSQIRLIDDPEGATKSLPIGIAADQAGFSSDGKLVAIRDISGKLHIFDLEKGRRIRIYEGGGRSIAAFAFSPIADQIVYGFEGSLGIANAETGEIVARLSVEFSGVFDDLTLVVFSPDKTRLAVGQTNGFVSCWDLNTGESLLFKDHEKSKVVNNASVTAIAFSQDGSKLATGGIDQTIHVYELGLPIKPKSTDSGNTQSAAKSEPSGSNSTQPEPENPPEEATDTEPQVNPKRTWNSTSGFKVEATLVGIKGGTVILKRADNSQTVEVPIKILSSIDQEYLKSIQAK